MKSSRHKYEPVADVRTLSANLRIANWNGERLFPAMMDQFRQTCRQMLPCIGAAVERANCEEAAHTLQFFEGTCRLIGARRLEAMCEDLRGICNHGAVPEPHEWAALAQAVGDFLEFAEIYVLLTEPCSA
jgi:hypothetical protein